MNLIDISHIAGGPPNAAAFTLYSSPRRFKRKEADTCPQDSFLPLSLALQALNAQAEEEGLSVEERATAQVHALCVFILHTYPEADPEVVAHNIHRAVVAEFRS